MSVPDLKRRVEAALAEAGYPDATVTGPPHDPSILIGSRSANGEVPDRIAYKAHKVAGHPCTPCWDCWDNRPEDCTEGCDSHPYNTCEHLLSTDSETESCDA